MPDAPYVDANVERFAGFAGQYDDYRPSPPKAILDILPQLAQTARPGRVVDIGSGTGLSTRFWADSADEVIGVEPSDDMRGKAEERSAGLTNVRYLKGFSTATGLPDACADIITITHALHWMEPTGTFAEVARLLRPGGVFAACDTEWPPIFNWEAQLAIRVFMKKVNQLAADGKYESDIKAWEKSGHLERITASGHFRYSHEFFVHSVEQGNADRVVGIALSLGTTQTLLKKGVSQEDLGIPAFRAEALRIVGNDLKPWYFSYRVRVAVK